MPKIQIADQQLFEWQMAVRDKDLLTPPGTPILGDRYLVNGIGVGAWAGQNYNIAMWDGVQWMFAVKRVGMVAWVKDEGKLYVYTAVDTWTAWDPYTSSDAANLASCVSAKHTAGSETQGGDISGTVGAATVATVGGKTAAAVAGAVDKAATYNSGLGVIEFDLP